MANLSNKLDRILTKCIQSIEEKGWTIEDCLNQYTTYRDELEPMLRTVMRLRRARRVRPTASFRSNAQSRIRARLQASRRSTILRMADDLSDRKKTTYPPRLQLAGSLIPLLIVSLLIIGTGTALAYSADNAKPGDLLFQIDRAIEQIRIRLENDTPQLIRLHLQFADERIEEVVDLVRQGNTIDFGAGLAGYKEQIRAIALLITEAQIAGQDISPLVNETNEAIVTQKEKLQDLLPSVSIDLKQAIRDTIEEAEDTQNVVTAPLPTKEPVVNATSEPFVFEPDQPTQKPPTTIPSTIPPPTPPPPTIPPPNEPPGPTDTPGSYILPSATPPDNTGETATPTYFPYATPTPLPTTPMVTPTGSITPTHTPSPSATPTPTSTPNKTPPTNTPHATR
jgi:hypothetical protein